MTTLARTHLIQTHGRAWLDRCWTMPVLLVAALVLSKNSADPDLWGHVQFGRDALMDGLPTGATYTYTYAGHPWVNHENLAEIALAAGVDTLGPVPLLMAKCLVGVVIIGLVIVAGRRSGASESVVLGGALLVSLCLMHFWSMRPQVFSFALFTGLLLILERSFRNWNPTDEYSAEEHSADRRAENWTPAVRRQLRWLWLAPPLVAVWTNTHGAFVAGVCILGLYSFGRSVEAIWNRGSEAWPMVGRLTLVFVASCLATLVNPYGLGLHRWLAGSLVNVRPEIIEWCPPELLSAVWLQFWILAGVFVVATLGTRRRRDWTHVTILAVTFWQATEHRRHIPFFAIPFGLWMLGHVHSALVRWRFVREPSAASGTGPFRKQLAFFAVAALACVMIGHSLVSQFRSIRVRRDTYPVAALQYMADHGLYGKVVTEFIWTQYAIAALGDRTHEEQGIRVPFDGRFDTCYPQQMADIYFDFAMGTNPGWDRYRSPHSPEIDETRILDLGSPDLALIDRKQINTVKVLEQHADRWVLLYQDQLAQLWGRRCEYDDPRSPRFLAPEKRRITDDPQAGATPWPALPAKGPERSLP